MVLVLSNIQHRSLTFHQFDPFADIALLRHN